MRPLVGFSLVGAGVVMIYGGMTGRLAPMLAALFIPSALEEKDGGNSGGLIGRLWDAIPKIPGTPIPLA